MRLRYLALAVVLMLILNAGITYGIVRWASPSGSQGPQGEQGQQGIPGPVASPDYCSAALSAPAADLDSAVLKEREVAKYCPP
jgi:hypothetical protein